MDRIRVPVASRRLRATLVALVVVGILGISLVRLPDGSGQGLAPLAIPIDKWVHATSYAGLAGALAYALLAPDHSVSLPGLLAVFLAAVAFGGAVELLQGPLPWRSTSLLDAAANTVGALVGTLPWAFVRGRRRVHPFLGSR